MQDQPNVTRKDHKHWQYLNKNTQAPDTIYFPENSRIGCYIRDFELTKDNLSETQKAAFIETMDELANLAENYPDGYKEAIAAREAKLALTFGPNKQNRGENFEFDKHPEFSAMISACTEEQLALISDLFNNEALQKNQHNLAVSIKLFFSRIHTPEQENEFLDTLKEILDQPEADDAQQKAAKLILLATELEQEKYYNDLNLYPRLYAFLADPAQCTEKTLKQRWLPDFLPVMLEFPPQGEIDEALSQVVENQPFKLIRRNIGNQPHVYEYDILKYGDEYLAINYNESLGEGVFGEVYKAYKLDNAGKLIIAQPYAIKLTKNSAPINSDKIISLEEFETEAQYNKIAGLKMLEPKEHRRAGDTQIQEYFLPLEFISGQNFGGEDYTNDFAELKNFLTETTLAQRAMLARELGIAVANLHKKGIFHGDLKGKNIRLNKQKLKNGKFAYDVTPIDFGLSANIKNPDNLDGSINLEIQGTRNFIAPELFFSDKAYATTDIYACAPFYKAIYGAKNPFAKKHVAPTSKVAETNYENEGIMNDTINIKDANYKHINSCITNFTDRCEEKDPLKRLNDAEVQIFNNSNCAFTEMAEMSPKDLKQNGFNETDFDLHAAKCILISQGLWDTKIDGTLKFSDIDHELYPEINAEIVNKYKLAEINIQDDFQKMSMQLIALNTYGEKEGLLKQHEEFKRTIYNNLHEILAAEVIKIRDAIKLVPMDQYIGNQNNGTLKDHIKDQFQDKFLNHYKPLIQEIKSAIFNYLANPENEKNKEKLIKYLSEMQLKIKNFTNSNDSTVSRYAHEALFEEIIKKSGFEIPHLKQIAALSHECETENFQTGKNMMDALLRQARILFSLSQDHHNTYDELFKTTNLERLNKNNVADKKQKWNALNLNIIDYFDNRLFANPEDHALSKLVNKHMNLLIEIYAHKILSGKVLGSHDREIIQEINNQYFKDSITINKLASADYSTRIISMYSLIDSAKNDPSHIKKYSDWYNTLKNTTNNSSDLSYSKFLLPAFIAAVNSTDLSDPTDKITNKLSHDIIKGIVEDASLPKSWWDSHFGDASEKRSNARKVIKNMPLQLINKLVNGMNPETDKNKINEITKIALSRDIFYLRSSTGIFRQAITDMSKELIKPESKPSFLHSFFGKTSTYKRSKNAAGLADLLPDSPAIIVDTPEPKQKNVIENHHLSDKLSLK